MKNIILTLLWLILSFTTQADTWRLIVTAKPAENTTGIYEYSVKVDEWNFTSREPNPLYNCINGPGQCRFAIGLDHSRSHGSAIRTSLHDKSPYASSAKTIGELGHNIMLNHPHWFNQTFISLNNNKQTCFFISYMINGGAHLKLPGGSCTYADLPPSVCRIKEPYIELSHLINGEQNSSLVATGKLSISCTQNMKVRIVGKYGSGEIILDKKRNFRSLITVNDQPLSKGVVISATPQSKTVNIKSTLRGTVPPAGEYKGSTVIIIAPE